MCPVEPDWQSLSPRLLTMWRLLSAGGLGTLGAAGVVTAAYAGGTVPAVAAAGATATAIGLVWWMQARRYDAWAYATRDLDLMLRRGVLVRRVSVVPYGRMQFVDVAQGPLDRRFDIAAVVLHTAAAATDARIPGLPEQDATRLRDRLAELGEAHGAGL